MHWRSLVDLLEIVCVPELVGTVHAIHGFLWAPLISMDSISDFSGLHPGFLLAAPWISGGSVLTLCWPGTLFQGSRNVPNVPNNVPNIPGHVPDM